MRARITLSLFLFILLIPGLSLIVSIYIYPIGVEQLVDRLVSLGFPGTTLKNMYSTLVLGVFIYVIVLVSAIIYLSLSDLVNKYTKEEEKENEQLQTHR